MLYIQTVKWAFDISSTFFRNLDINLGGSDVFMPQKVFDDVNIVAFIVEV